MSAIDCLRNATRVKLSGVTYLLRLPLRRDRMVMRDPFCVDKPAGALAITLNSSVIGFPDANFDIHLLGNDLGRDATGRHLIQWRADHEVGVCFMSEGNTIRIDRVVGQITTELISFLPPQEDRSGVCSGRPHSWNVRLTAISGTQPNELEFQAHLTDPGCTAPGLGGSGKALNIMLTAEAGVELPPPPPPGVWGIRFRPSSVCLDENEEARVAGEITMDGNVVPEHGNVSINVTAEPPEIRIEPSDVAIPLGHNQGRFTAVIPADYSGTIRVTAGGRHAELRVTRVTQPLVLFGCEEPFIPDYYYIIDRLSLPPWDPCTICVISDINVYRDMIGSRDGVLFRYLSRRNLEYFGEQMGRSAFAHAINVHGQVAGGFIDADGQFSGFVYGSEKEDALPGLIAVKNVVFNAISDAGLAVGYQLINGGLQAVSYINGKTTELSSFGGNWSTAVSVNGHGQIIGAYGQDQDAKYAFLYEAGKMTDLGNLGGTSTRATAINEAGTVVGSSRTPDGTWHGFAWTEVEKGMIDLKPVPGFENSVANDINDSGLVVGTVSGGPQAEEVTGHGFRFTSQWGMQDLNDLIDPTLGLVVTDALKVNDAGEILAYGVQNKSFGFFLMRPIEV